MRKRWWMLAAWSGLLVSWGACSCDGSQTDKQRSRMVLDLSVDEVGDFILPFGDVTVGAKAVEKITVRNSGNTELVLHPQRPTRPFGTELRGEQLRVPVGGSASLPYTFSPSEPTAGTIEQVVTLETNEGPGGQYRIRLGGRGVLALLHCEPARADFGPVVLGSERRQTVRCTNPLAIPQEVMLLAFGGNTPQAFSASLVGQDGDRLRLEPDESFELELSFRPETLGRNDASLELRDPNQQLLAIVDVAGEGVSTAVRVEPSGCLDFEYVAVGERAQQSLSFTNVGTDEVRILAFDLPESEFSILTTPPVPLYPGEGPAEVVVEFHPTAAGKKTVELEVFTDDAREGGGSLRTCLTGFGGGPKLECRPELIDFGMVAIGSPITKPIRCTNEGIEPESGIAIDPLVITEVRSDAASFSPTIRNADGSAGPKSGGYLVGESFIVEVQFAPTEEGIVTGGISIEGQAGVGGDGVQEIPVVGEGRDLPPCEFTLIPPALNFGLVARGEQRTLSFGVKNHLDTACLINELRLSEGSDPAYSLAEIGSLELAGLETLEVPVTLSATEYRDPIAGKVEFQISNPAAPSQEVVLRGKSARSCLTIEPSETDFGITSPGCQSHVKTLSLSNTCSLPLKIIGAEIGETLQAGDYVIRRPVLPLTLSPGRREELGVIFQPSDYGPSVGVVELEVEGEKGAESDFYLAALRGMGSDEEIQTDLFTQADRPKVDILFVMDNSGSMEPYQNRIGANLPSFISSAEEQDIDFQIAVTTTGVTGAWGGGCPGGANGNEDGRFFPVDGSAPRILTADTPRLSDRFLHNLRVGTCHQSEFSFEAAYRALSPPLIHEEKDSRPRTPPSPYQDGNAGFLRPDASLSIIFVTDELEQSSIFGKTPMDYMTFFKGIKGERNPHMLKMHAISGARRSAGPRACAAEEGDRLLVAVDETDGVWLDICTPTSDNEAWAANLRLMSKGVFGFGKRFVLRGVPTDRNNDGLLNERDIEVYINGKLRPPVNSARAQVWTYKSETNAVEFTPLFVPKSGAEIEIVYQIGCGNGG